MPSILSQTYLPKLSQPAEGHWGGGEGWLSARGQQCHRGCGYLSSWKSEEEVFKRLPPTAIFRFLGTPLFLGAQDSLSPGFPSVS